MRVLKGTDPEVFAFHGTNPVPAHRLGFGDKYTKKDFIGGKAFRDGYAIEINVAPSPNWWTVAQRVQNVVRSIAEYLPVNYRLVTMPSIPIDLTADLKDAPPDVMMFGCDPSLDAYTMESKVPDIVAMDHPYRYAGCHLHFSGEGVHKGSKHWSTRLEDACTFIKLMDLYVGLPFACLFPSQQSWARRRFYGQAGEFRHQRYPDGAIGIEYRTLGPEALNHPALLHLAFGIGEAIFLNYHQLKTTWDDGINIDLTTAINTGEGAMDLLQSLPTFYSKRLIALLNEDLPFLSFDLVQPETRINRDAWFTWVNDYMYGEGDSN